VNKRQVGEHCHRNHSWEKQPIRESVADLRHWSYKELQG
jgi:hypothetical protein